MPLTPAVVREYDRDTPGRAGTETATFGLGCFWGPDAAFATLDGVVRTRVGYAGGTKPDPTYHALGDHTEVVQVDFDPTVVGYRDLLGAAFERHDPRRQVEKRQYQHLVCTDGESQRETLAAFLDANGYEAAEVGTRIESLSRFHLAETYHQKYNLKGKRWVTKVFDELGYDETDVRESPAAALLNAHVAGHDVSAPFLVERTRE